MCRSFLYINCWRWYSWGRCELELVFRKLRRNICGSGSSIVVSPYSTTNYYVLAQGTCNTTTCALNTVTVTPLLSNFTRKSNMQWRSFSGIRTIHDGIRNWSPAINNTTTTTYTFTPNAGNVQTL